MTQPEESSLREFRTSVPTEVPSRDVLDHTFNFLKNVPDFIDLDVSTRHHNNAGKNGVGKGDGKIELQDKQSAIFVSGNWYDPRKLPVLMAKRQYEFARGVKKVPLFIGGAQGRLTSAQQQKFGGEHLAHRQALLASGVSEEEIIVISKVEEKIPQEQFLVCSETRNFTKKNVYNY